MVTFTLVVAAKISVELFDFVVSEAVDPVLLDPCVLFSRLDGVCFFTVLTTVFLELLEYATAG